MHYSANKTTISYSTIGSADTTPIDYLMEVPEIGAAPEKIDITTLGDSVKKYIPGTKDYGDLVFKFLYDNTDEHSNYKIFKRLDDVGAVAVFTITYPDQSKHQFNAIPSVKMDAGTLNGAMTFSVTMLLQSEITNPDA